MTTRYAKEGAAPAQHRYASAPEYAELRGIQGAAVAAKAALLNDPRKRSLLFFIQAMSLKEGGLKGFTRELLAAFPERIGTQTMHKAGIKTGREYPRETAIKIHFELNPKCGPVRSAMLKHEEAEPGYIQSEANADRLLQECQRLAADELSGALIDLCIDPCVQIRLPGESEDSLELDRRAALEADDNNQTRWIGPCGVPYFRDLIGALLAYQQLYAARVRSRFVLTSIAREVWAVLDHCLATGKMDLIEGLQGIGKTTAVEAWCEMHLGQCRFVSLSGSAHKTGIFRSIAKACGLPCTYACTTTDTQSRVEDFLQRTRLLLVVDEAHFIVPGGDRIRARPEMVDWLDTAIYNHSVPCCLIATPQFTRRLEYATQRIGWNSAQFWRRIKRKIVLPLQPSIEDLRAVAERLLPEGNQACIKHLVGHAVGSKFPMDELADTITEARYLAEQSGRSALDLGDVQRAIAEYRLPTAAARPPVIEQADVPRQRRRGRPTVSEPQPARGNHIAAPLQSSRRAAAARDFAGDEPAGTNRLEAPIRDPLRAGDLVGA